MEKIKRREELSILERMASDFLICLKGLANRNESWAEGGSLRFLKVLENKREERREK